MVNPTTPRQHLILDALEQLTAAKGYCPTYVELAERIGMRTCTLQGHIQRMVKKGLLETINGKHRTLQPVARQARRLPLLAAQTGEIREVVDLHDVVLARNGCFVVEAPCVMQIAGILPGDRLLVSPEVSPQKAVPLVLQEGNDTRLVTGPASAHPDSRVLGMVVMVLRFPDPKDHDERHGSLD